MFKKIITILVILILLTGLGFWYVNKKINGYRNASPVEQKFTIETGEGVNQISSRMFQAGLISNNLYFDLYVWKNKQEDKIVAGTYTLRPNMTIPEIVDLITKGIAEPQDIKITIIEGWNSKQIGEYLAKKNIISNETFKAELKNVAKYRAKYSFLQVLDPKKNTLEGFLFPDTYFIYPYSTEEMIITKMLDNFDKKLTPALREDIAKDGRNLKDVIILASIIEKEVPRFDDQKIVSGIFLDRLKIGHPLQADSTLSYVLGQNKEKYSFEDSRVDSPYNTYLNRGLPPGPISNPGLNAIMAAIYPKESDYFYFLTNPKTGEVIYSRTYEEHLKNKEKHGL